MHHKLDDPHPANQKTTKLGSATFNSLLDGRLRLVASDPSCVTSSMPEQTAGRTPSTSRRLDARRAAALQENIIKEQRRGPNPVLCKSSTHSACCLS